MLTIKQAILRLQKLSGESYPPPYCISALSRRFAPSERSLKGLLNTMYRKAGGWEMPDNDTIILSKVITSAGLHAFGATVQVVLHRSGSVDFNCRLRNGSHVDGYDYNIGVLVSTLSGKTLFFRRSGHIDAARLDKSERIDNRNETIQHPLIAEFFNEFINSWIDTNTTYESNITSTVEDCIGFLVNWIVGLALIPNPAVGLIIFLGAELGSLIETGSLSAGARLISGTLWMLGPYGTFFAVVAEGVARIGTNSRELHQEEYDWANELIFRGTLPPRDQLVLTDTIGGGERAFVFPRFDGKITLNMGEYGFADPRKYKLRAENAPADFNKTYGEVFIHELVHAWQIAHAGRSAASLADAFASKICEITGDNPYQYGSNPTLPFEEYNLEQQASIVSDWFSKYFKVRENNEFFLDRAAGEQDPRFKYIRDYIQQAI